MGINVLGLAKYLSPKEKGAIVFFRMRRVLESALMIGRGEHKNLRYKVEIQG